MGRIEGKVCIVTGGAVGIGKIYCQALSAEGGKIVILDLKDGSALAQELGGFYMRTDVSKADDARAAIKATLKKFGTIDVLVNNAAMFSSLAMQRYDEITADLWDKVMAVNVRGAFLMIQMAAPVMEENGRGKIINITSGTTYKGMPGMLHYVSSKGALVSMTRSLSRELGASNVCINNLSPGLILSDSIQANKDHLEKTTERVLASRALKRHGYPQDLIGALLFLASDDSDFITGQTISVDGGSINT